VSPLRSVLTVDEVTALHSHAIMPYPGRRSAVLPGRLGLPAQGDGGVALALAQVVTGIRAGGPLDIDMLRGGIATCLARLPVFHVNVQSDASHFLEQALGCLCLDFNVNCSLMRAVTVPPRAGPAVLQAEVDVEWDDLGLNNPALFNQLVVRAADTRACVCSLYMCISLCNVYRLGRSTQPAVFAVLRASSCSQD
jgi:hypothetical protein